MPKRRKHGTPQRVSKQKPKRLSRSHAGRKDNKRSRAAKRGWLGRRNNAAKRSAAAVKGWKTRRKTIYKKRKKQPQNIAHIATIKFTTRERSTDRSFQRDIFIPAPRDATFRELKEIAKRTLSGNEQYILQHFTPRKTVKIGKGPKTRKKKAELR